MFELYLATSGTKLNPALAADRTVTSFALTPDASAVVYIADQDQNDVFELYRVSLSNPGISTRLNGNLPAGGDVLDFAITPDGSSVVYRADQTVDDVVELYRTILSNGANSKLNPDYAGSQDVDAFVILPNSSGVVYRANQDTPTVKELYRQLFATPSTNDRLILPPLGAGQDVQQFAVTANSTNVVYQAKRPLVTDPSQIFVAPAAGGGGSIQVNDVLTPGGAVTDFALTPDGLSVVYRADQDTDETYELYRVPLTAPGPGNSTKLNGNLLPAGGDVTTFAVIPGSTGVVYIADQNTDDVFELFRTVFGGGNSQLNPPYVANQDVVDFALFPNGSGVVYRADQNTDGVNEIYRAIFGVPGSLRLNPALVGGQNVSTYTVAPDSNSAIYRANEDNAAVVELYRAGFSTAGSSTKLNSPAPLAPGRNVSDFTVR